MSNITNEQANNMTYDELREAFEDGFRDMLNGDDVVSVQGMEFEPAEVLKELDPIAYREAFFDYIDSTLEDS